MKFIMRFNKVGKKWSQASRLLPIKSIETPSNKDGVSFLEQISKSIVSIS